MGSTVSHPWQCLKKSSFLFKKGEFYLKNNLNFFPTVLESHARLGKVDLSAKTVALKREGALGFQQTSSVLY